MQPGEIKAHHGPSHANLTQHLHSLYPTHKTNPSTSYLNMQPGEAAGLQSLPHMNPDQCLAHFSTLYTDRFSLNPQIDLQGREFSSNTSSLSNNSISDEAKVHQISLNHERKLRRLISNRECARRSRMRKRKQLEELQSQVVQLQIVNYKLTEKFIHLLECNHQILQENAQLKEEVSFFQKILPNMQTPVRYLEDVTHNTVRLKAEASNQFISSSMDLLH
ncbi:hypothetical protein L1049_027348 [Liquidambar formosana]|uniref:BZIP domain-containing protein n=1 Tax=Liquidambar formosana TaxID=63359 RepID=A0AAP0WSB1_LIQFO